MQGTYSELRDLAVSQDLLERLIMAYIDVAIEVYIDPNATVKRKLAAVQLFLNPRSLAEKTRYGIVKLASNDSDEALKAAALTSFQVYVSTFPDEAVA
jgi:hypothetical protein